MNILSKLATILVILAPVTNSIQASDAMEPEIRSIVVVQNTNGCCKQKKDNEWRVIGRNFYQCDKWNKRYDNDDVTKKESGRIWWDSACSK